jgi:hypothetical protein
LREARVGFFAMFVMILPVVAVIAKHGEAGGHVTPESHERLPASPASRRAALIGPAALGAAPLADPAVREAFTGQQPATAEGSGESAGGLLANVVPVRKTDAARR